MSIHENSARIGHDPETDRIIDIIREIVARRTLSPPIRPILLDDDLREVGLTSLDLVNLMLAVEAAFELKIPDDHMTLRNFRSVSTINALVTSLQQKQS